MPRPRLNALVPLLRARDLRETREFYERLGFEVATSWPSEDPVWISMRRDGVQLMFYCLPEQPNPSLSGALYVYPDNVTAVWEQVKDSVNASQPLSVTDRGARQFQLTDPNGYVLNFGEEA